MVLSVFCFSGNTKFQGKHCNKTLSCATDGITSLKHHGVSKKHLEMVASTESLSTPCIEKLEALKKKKLLKSIIEIP